MHSGGNTTYTIPDVGEDISISWDGGLICASYVIAVQAAYAAFLILQLRLSVWMVLLSALNLSVAGIWSMHFIGMAAMSSSVDLRVDPWVTFGSSLCGLVPCAVALTIVHYKVPKHHLVEDPLSLAAHVDAMCRAPHRWLVSSAALIAGGVCAMHYTGMRALETTAMLEIRWGILMLSVFIALFAAIAALYFAFILPSTRAYAMPTAFVAGVAVCGMHYVGMYGMVMRMGVGTVYLGHPGVNYLRDIAVYIAVGASMVSAGSLAFASSLYREMVRAGADRMTSAVETSGKIAESLAKFDLEGAEGHLNGAALPQAIGNALSMILNNLNVYRPYLPDALFVGYEGEEEALCSAASVSMAPTHEYSDEALSCSPGLTGSTSDIPPSPPDVRGHFSLPTGLLAQRVTSDQVGRGAPGLVVRNVTTAVFMFAMECTQGAEMFVRYHTTSLGAVAQAVKQRGGSLDHFEGEKMFASFNAFRRNSTHSMAALLCARGVLQKAREIALPRVAVGVAAGPAYVGTLGTSKNLSPSLLGDVPNIAEQMARVAKLTCHSVLTNPKVYNETALEVRQQVLLHRVMFADVVVDRRQSILYAADVARDYAPAPVGEHEWMYELERRDDPLLNALNDVGFVYHVEGLEAAEMMLATRDDADGVAPLFKEALTIAGTVNFMPSIDLPISERDCVLTETTAMETPRARIL